MIYDIEIEVEVVLDVVLKVFVCEELVVILIEIVYGFVVDVISFYVIFSIYEKKG